ncbi:unnamed protein product, partial [Sphacelaria rigidula]
VGEQRSRPLTVRLFTREYNFDPLTRTVHRRLLHGRCNRAPVSVGNSAFDHAAVVSVSRERSVCLVASSGDTTNAYSRCELAPNPSPPPSRECSRVIPVTLPPHIQS